MALTSANIIFNKSLELYLALLKKNIYVTNFSFLMDLLKPPTRLMVKIFSSMLP